MTEPRRKSRWHRFGWTVLRLYLLLLLFGWLFSERLIFPAPPSSYQDDPQFFKLAVPPSGEKITARFYENPSAPFVLLYSHGNGEDLGECHPRLRYLHSLGFAVLAYDYRGYGTSEGKPGERAAGEDILAAWNWLTQERGYAPAQIILYGRSVGSGPSCWLAARKNPAGLILESPFVSAFRVRTHFPIVPFDRFPNLRRIREINAPVLILHGRQDRVVPFWHGRKLYEAAAPPKSFLEVPEAGHNNIIQAAGPRYAAALQAFVKSFAPAE
jgi:fermentation-respiration switch protein FrsA (DUF1100 family)